MNYFVDLLLYGLEFTTALNLFSNLLPLNWFLKTFRKKFGYIVKTGIMTYTQKFLVKMFYFNKLSAFFKICLFLDYLLFLILLRRRWRILLIASMMRWAFLNIHRSWLDFHFIFSFLFMFVAFFRPILAYIRGNVVRNAIRTLRVAKMIILWRMIYLRPVER